MAQIELTEQEGQEIINCIDTAVKVKGLAMAEVAVYLTKKIQAAFNPVEPKALKVEPVKEVKAEESAERK